MDLDLDGVDAVAGGDVAIVGGGPVDAEAWQQRGRDADSLGGGPAGGAA